MSSYDDDIDFDFFDEPETQEATQRRRLPRFERPPGGGGPRPPLRTPTGLTPLLRLVGLILFAIFIVVVLVLWVQSCRGAAKHDTYASYIDRARAIGHASDQIGDEVQRKLTTPGIKRDALVSSLEGYASSQDQALTDAESIRPPGPLRTEHSHLIDALQLRAQGLHALARGFAQASVKTATKDGETLSQQAQMLTASDVVWNVFFYDATKQELTRQSITGVNVPQSSFFPNPELAGTTSMVRLVQGFGGASTGGQQSTGSCPCGDELVSVEALPQGITLTTSQPNTVKATTDLAFRATVKNSGNVQETQVPVTLTIGTGPTAIVKHQTITLIDPGTTTTVTFKGFNLPASMFGAKEQLKVEVAPVSNETRTQNNSATYDVFFSV